MNYFLYIRLFILFACFVSPAFATVTVYNQTQEKDHALFKKNFVDKLLKENFFFNTIISELHFKSELEYRLMFVDPITFPHLNSKKDIGSNIQYGGFLTPKETQRDFSLDRLGSEKEKADFKDMFSKLQGHPVIVVFVYLIKDETDGYFYNFPRSTMIQESFHALQYEYYHRRHLLDRYHTAERYPAHEVEGDLLTILSGSTFSEKEKLTKIKNMDRIIDYFFKIKSGYSPSNEEICDFDVVLNDIWKELLASGGYKAEYFGQPIEHVDIQLHDMETLNWLFKEYSFPRPEIKLN